ncbi:hypothetical protein BKN14_05565 [Candidatus Gracilibacteria bacterium HOT-871]|nr:hypothetical protein BKN14_05565 [Candidatus Gracilibacteria bacterium HOT-871]RKW21814.1 MAG: hypothetical protein D8B46_06735 [Candidatus Gracilibacteria bacterium]
MKTSLPISNHLEHQLEAQYIEKLDPKVQSVVNAVKTKFILFPISKKVQEELKNLESANDDIYSQKTQDIVDDTRQKVLSTMTLEEAIKFSEEEEANIDLLSKTIIKLNNMISEGKNISNSFEYGNLVMLYKELPEHIIKHINSVFKMGEDEDIYDSFREVYLVEKIYANIRASENNNNQKSKEFLISSARNYLDELKRLRLHFDTTYLLSKAESDYEAKFIMEYIAKMK